MLHGSPFLNFVLSSNRNMRGQDWAQRGMTTVLFFSCAFVGFSIADAFESSSIEVIVNRLHPIERRLLHHRLELSFLSDIGNNEIMDRQGFLADAFWSTTSSSIAIASTTPTATGKDAELVCQNGALMGESAVPGAYSSACMGLSERIVPLPRYRDRMINKPTTIDAQPNNVGTIVVQQKAGGSGNTGMTLWNSGLLLTRLLDAMVDELQQRQGGDSTIDNYFWRNQDVIELGCGTGLCSIAAHRLGAKSVVATDGNPRVLELAQANIRQNHGESIDSKGASPANIRAEPLQWGFLNAMDYSESASFVIGADLTYNPGSWDILAETIATILKTENDNMVNSEINDTRNSKQCYALYLSVGHDGFNVNAEVDGFLSVAKEKGLVSIADGVEGIDLNELLRKTLTDTEKKILAQSGGFRVLVLGRKSMKRL